MSGPRGRIDGNLAVTCWCERRIVHVAPDRIAAGVTKSCGSPRCTPLLVGTAA